MAKSKDAFRTIGEVAEWLDTPAHVLRFWESKFTQIKPVKRAGGRRYYRPADMALVGGLKVLLHEDGMTIKGAQKLLREKGVKHVAARTPPLPGTEDVEAAVAETVETGAEVVPLASRKHATPAAFPAGEPPADAATLEAGTGPDLAMRTDSATAPERRAVPRPDFAAALAEIPADPEETRPSGPGRGALTALAQATPGTLLVQAARLAPLVERLQAIRDRLAAA